ncbi:phage tail tube protein [Streptomyces bohaiensis]|uniref:phage tail tube protein n=1 Tax=Streptomyces bohaiensis TaxID=1431344 RepID=UPI003B7B25A4
MARGRNAKGTQFKRRGDGGGEAPGEFVAIGRVADIQGPSRSREALETTAHDSPRMYREFVKGLKDAGEVSLTLRYDPADANHALLDADFDDDSDDLRDYQIVILPDTPDEHTWTFQAIITDLSDGFPHDGIMERSATVKISGVPTLEATGASPGAQVMTTTTADDDTDTNDYLEKVA